MPHSGKVTPIMRLTSFSDYALRLLIYAAVRPSEIVTITYISNSYGISKNHLMKITNTLAQAGNVETLRGSGGGARGLSQNGQGLPWATSGLKQANHDFANSHFCRHCAFCAGAAAWPAAS